MRWNLNHALDLFDSTNIAAVREELGEAHSRQAYRF